MSTRITFPRMIFLLAASLPRAASAQDSAIVYDVSAPASGLVVKTADCIPGGSFCEFALPTPNSFPGKIVSGPDGSLWFTEGASGKIGRITPSGEISEFETPSGANALNDIAIGPDGDLWFTEGNCHVIDPRGQICLIDTSKIARITLSGAVTEFPNDTGLPIIPFRIAAGSDGNLWFTSTVAVFPAVVRMTPGGSFTVVKHGLVNGGICAGPDGALWITGRLGSPGLGYIGRLTTSGLLTEYPTSLDPTFITNGPDRALWFTESEVSGAIGRIDTFGITTEFPIRSGLIPFELVAGGDGNVWFTEGLRGGGDNRIGRITPAGTLTEFPVPTSAPYLGGIAWGLDGNVWFTEPSVNAIVRFVPPVGREQLNLRPGTHRPRAVDPRAPNQ